MKNLGCRFSGRVFIRNSFATGVAVLCLSCSQGGNWLAIDSGLEEIVGGSASVSSYVGNLMDGSPGSFDPDFGESSNGESVFGMSYGTASAVDDSGRLVVVGAIFNTLVRDTWVARFNEDGSLDQTFGQDYDLDSNPDGYVLIDAPSPYDDMTNQDETPKDVVVQPDGSVLVLVGQDATFNKRVILFRLSEDGDAFDTSFGNQGFVEFDIPLDTSETPSSLEYIEDSGPDFIIVGGEFNLAFDTFFVARFFADTGAVDTNFGMMNGLLYGGPGERTLQVYRPKNVSYFYVLIEKVTSGFFGYRIIRVLSDGTQDMSYGVSGNVLHNPSNLNYRAARLFETSSGHLIVAGSTDHLSQDPNVYDAFFAKYGANGIVSNTFGGHGVCSGVDSVCLMGFQIERFLRSEQGSSNSNVFDIAINQNDEIVVAVEVTNAGELDYLVGRLTSDGELDTRFNAGKGYVVWNSLAGAWDIPTFLQIRQSAGVEKILVGGFASNTGKTNFIQLLN